MDLGGPKCYSYKQIKEDTVNIFNEYYLEEVSLKPLLTTKKINSNEEEID